MVTKKPAWCKAGLLSTVLWNPCQQFMNNSSTATIYGVGGLPS